MERLAARLVDPASLSTLVTLLYLPAGLMGPLLVDVRRLGGDWWSWLAVGLVGQVVVMVVFWIGRVACARVHSRRLRLWSTLGVIVSSTVLRAIAVSATAITLGLARDFEWQYRLISGVIVQSVVLVTLAAVVVSYRQHQSVVAEREAVRQSLVELNNSLAERLDGIRANLVAEVHRSIDPLVFELDRLLDQTLVTGDRDAANAALRRLSDDELRPLSHRLAREPLAQDVARLPREKSRLPRAPLPQRMAVSDLIQPITLAVMAGISAVSPIARHPDAVNSVLFLTVAIAVVGAVAYIAREALGAWRPRLVIGLACAIGLGSLALGLALATLELGGVIVPPDLMTPALLIGAVWGGLIAAYAVANARRAETEADLRQSVDRLRASSSILRRSAFVAQRRLAFIVHGSIQSALHAAAIRLGALSTVDAAAIAGVRADLRAALSVLDGNSSPHSMLTDTLQDISELWDGTCTVRWTMDHRTIRALVESPDAAMSAAEISRECVSNAIRHGRASEVWITITRSGEHILVTSLDDGSGPPDDSSPGLGSTLFDELCDDWNLQRLDEHTRVQARLATSTVVAQ